MSLVVQKYGGSSVADADGIKRVAQRIVATRKAGHSVVVEPIRTLFAMIREIATAVSHDVGAFG